MNLRASGRVCGLFGFLLLAAFSTGQAEDSFEPNDEPSQAHPLTSGEAIESWISTSQDEDWYRFSHADPNANVTIALTSLPADYDVEVYVQISESQLDLVGRSENPDTEDEGLEGMIPAGEYFIRVYGFSGVFDADDSYLLTATFGGAGGNTAPQVSVRAPNGGETLQIGTTQTISYTATDAETPPGSLTIGIGYSTDGGSSWNVVTNSTSNTGRFDWTVPNTPSTQARVRVVANDGELIGGDDSDGDFTISESQGNQAPQVTVVSPNGGETLSGGSTQAITYTATDPDSDDASLVITLEYSTNGGGAWTQIASNEANTGSFGWSVPSTATTQGRVRVTASDGDQTGNDSSDGNFTVTTPPQGANTLAVTNGTGESGTTITVQLTLDNENSVKAIQTDLVFDPAVLSLTSFSASSRASAFSDSSNAITAGRVRVVLYSTTSASLSPGTGTIAQVEFQAIGAGGSSSGVTPTTSVLSDPDGQALSVTETAGNVTVTGGGGTPPTVTVISPNGGESFQAGSIQNITYAASGGVGTLSVDIDYTAGGGIITPVGTSLDNTGTFAWSVPNTPTSQARIFVTVSDGQNESTDASDGDFSITSLPSGNVLSIGSAGGETGTTVSVPVQLTNDEAVKALQFDLSFDPSVAAFLRADAADRGASLADSAAVVGAGLARVVLFARGNETIGAGTGTVADLTFQLQGSANQTTLSPSNLILSDPSGAGLTVTGQPGVLTVTGGGGGNGPDVDIAVLKNPGRTRTLQIFVSVAQGSGSVPSLTVGGASVALSTLSAGVFETTVSIAQGNSSVTIVASDTNNKGTGTDQVTVSF